MAAAAHAGAQALHATLGLVKGLADTAPIYTAAKRKMHDAFRAY